MQLPPSLIWRYLKHLGTSFRNKVENYIKLNDDLVINEIAGIALGKCIVASASLESCQLSENFLGDAGLAAVAGALQCDLRYNHITSNKRLMGHDKDRYQSKHRWHFPLLASTWVRIVLEIKVYLPSVKHFLQKSPCLARPFLAMPPLRKTWILVQHALWEY